MRFSFARGATIEDPMDYTNHLPIVVYSKPSCVQCNATYRALDATGIPYKVVDLTRDENAYHYVTSMGYQQAPVVVVPMDYEVGGGTHWSGFDPDKIASIR